MYDELVKRLRSQCQGYGKECEDCNADGNCRSQMENEAADAIDEMSRLHEAQRQNLITLMNEEPEPKWIPVEERLPDEYVSVLCYCSRNGQYGCGEWCKEDNGTIYWIGLSGMIPTHWMPLPEPPKEENK